MPKDGFAAAQAAYDAMEEPEYCEVCDHTLNRNGVCQNCRDEHRDYEAEQAEPEPCDCPDCTR